MNRNYSKLDGFLKNIKNEPWPNEWPDEAFRLIKTNATKTQLRLLSGLIGNNASETEMHNFLLTNQVLFSFALYSFRTGHHGIWVYSKQVIKPKIEGVSKGIIPDFIVGGKNSDGFQWWIIELKGVNDNIFTLDSNNELYFSSTVNKGLCQLLEYINSCSEIQGHLRDIFKLKDFREPNGLLIVGKESELENDERRQKLKGAWNRLNTTKLEIRTYDWLLRNFTENAKAFHLPD
ncbi:MAG: DUF4263 domain-containing protein [Bacteroidales bacterium]|nr:DUF4263 domain-containing protein [Bacteroidales bacterium]